MEDFERDAFRLERFLWKKRPLIAKAGEVSKNNDEMLTKHFEVNDWKKFDGVVFSPKTREVYCSFYDDLENHAVLVPAIDLVFKNREIQKRVRKFRQKYY